MEAKIKWIDGVSFVAEATSGHAIVVDGAPEFGGRNTGSRPMELILMGLGSCAAFDITIILRKARQAFTGLQVELKAERADTIPAVFTQITMCFVVTGSNINEQAVAKAVSLSIDKYCSVAEMLRAGGVIVTYKHRVAE